MKNLQDVINESIFDMDDRSLDYATSDLIDMLNNKSEEEWNKRWDYLRLRLTNNGEKAPKDQYGYLQKKQGRVYIRLYRVSYDNTIKSMHFGRDTDGYILGWNRRANKVTLGQSRYIRFRDANLNSKEYDEYPLYILPNDLKKSYRELIK